MDVETSEAIERLAARIDVLDGSLRSEFRAGLAQSEQSLRSEFHTGLAQSRLHAETLVALLRDELKDEILQSRRHAQVLFENTRDDIRIIAEAVAHIAARLDARS